MRCPRQGRPPKVQSVLLSPILRSTYVSDVVSNDMSGLMGHLFGSIPHATPTTPGHPALSISPTNSTSPVVKESGLASDENTTPPVEDQVVSETAPAATDDAPMTDVSEAPAEEAPVQLAAPTAITAVDPVSVLDSETIVTTSKSPA